MLRRAALIIALSLTLTASGQKRDGLVPQPRRHSSSDLEVVILDSNGLPRLPAFLSRTFLASLPQVTTRLQSDENFSELPLAGTFISGVDLNVLTKSLIPDSSSSSAVAICRDGYTSPFPQTYISQHHPILVLTMDGLPPSKWAFKKHTYNAGPYFVTYQDFIPAFRVFAHEDRAQHPAEIIRLKIIPSSEIYRAITPPDADKLPPDSPVFDGFRIAQQNCFRCHNSSETGGTKAHRTWQHLAEVAKSRPDFFAAWVLNPQAIDPLAKMPPNLKYDQATLKALTRYFQTFAP